MPYKWQVPAHKMWDEAAHERVCHPVMGLSIPSLLHCSYSRNWHLIPEFQAQGNFLPQSATISPEHQAMRSGPEKSHLARLLFICTRCWALKVMCNEIGIFLEGVEYKSSIRIFGLFFVIEKNTSGSVFQAIWQQGQKYHCANPGQWPLHVAPRRS